MKERTALNPVIWSSLIFIAGASIASLVAYREVQFLNANPQLILPHVSTQLPLIYFFSAVVLIGLVLFIMPISRLRLVFRLLFVLLFAWGIFVALVLSLPLVPVVILAVAGGLAWFFSPRIWLHDLLLLLALVSIADVFGVLLSPWPVMILLLVISVYDFLAVRYGYMLWMVKKLSQSDSLPAFVIPRTGSRWNLNLRTGGLQNIMEGETAEREFSILGGGDIGWPLVLMVSVFSADGLPASLVMAVFSLAGLIAAFGIQRLFLKGKPIPALPPISLASLIGLLVIQLLMT